MKPATQQSVQDNITQSLSDALREVFGENEKAQRFIDVSRIPLICKSIFDIHENIKDLKEIVKTDAIDKEARVRALERNQWKWAGALVIVSPIITIALAAFFNQLFH